MKKEKFAKIISAVSAFLLLITQFDGLPYGYFTFLRLVVFGTTAFLAWLFSKIDKQGWMAVFLLIAILFNPIIPIYLGRRIWQIVDFVVMILLLVNIPKSKYRPGTKN